MKHKTSALLLAHLVVQDSSYDELVALAGLSQTTVALWIKSLRSKRLVYIEQWAADLRGYPTVARYRWGPETPDAWKPSLTSAQRAFNFRIKNGTI